MKCPVCKKKVDDNTLKCPYCKTRTGLLCKKCNTVNPIHNLTCKNCGEEILKVCPECNSVNFPHVKKCRKCGYIFGETQAANTTDFQELEYQPQYYSQKNAITLLSEALISDEKQIFSISGEKGIGKSVILKETFTKLQEHNFVWVFGKCTPLTQLTPGGVIQDMVLNLFNLPNFFVNSPEFKKDATKFFQNEFPEMSSNEISNFINFLYAYQYGRFEDLFINKKYTYEILYKVFEKISQRSKILIVADNFDFIDGFSYEFINNLLKRNKIPFKLILLYNEPKPAKAYFFSDNDKAYLDICVAPMNNVEMQEFCHKLEEAFSYTNDFERNQIFTKSNGHPAFLEQALSMCFDCQIGEIPFQLPDTFDAVISARLKYLKSVNPIAYKTLVGASVLGDKINLALLREVFGFEEKDFLEIIDYLKKMNFINPLNEIFYEFKNLLLWETILTTSKNDEDFEEINTRIANTLNRVIMNSNSIMGIIAQNLKQTQFALDIWTKNTKLAAYVGDVNLYVISQKQCLALINELDESETLKIRYNISERLGKLLADYNPKEALEFLPDAISNAKAIGDSPREIELLGYLSYCCSRTGNYYGNIECVDSVLEKISPDKKLEVALLKASKLESVLHIGNCGEVINTIDNDIMPVLDDFLAKQYKSNFSYDFVYEIWLKTYLILANALVLQGNDRSFEILTIIFDIIERNNIKEDGFICKSKITLAFANTIKGDFNTSEMILEDVLNQYKNNFMDNSTVLRWNLIKILNNFFRQKYNGLQEDLFKVVTYANNIGDEFTKNILKTLLGKIFKDNEQAKHALDIYNEQITYFAKEKMGLGALLTWYFIADATLITEGPHAAIEIAEQALEVAQNPKINNYLFITLFKTIIAKACIIISDYETAKIHIENAIILASKFNMKDILSRLYLIYGKYFQEIGLLKTDKQQDYLKGAGKMYEKASEIVKQTKNNCVHIEIEKAKNVLKSFCQLNSITI